MDVSKTLDLGELRRLAIQAQCAPGTNSELEQFQQEYFDALDTQTVLALIKMASLASLAPVGAKHSGCGLCGALTVNGCNQFGCGFLESGNGEPEPMTTDEARAYLVEFMNQHFADKTFTKYILADRVDRSRLAGDFAWQMATALRRQANPVAPQAASDELTHNQQHIIRCMDAWALANTLPSYSELSARTPAAPVAVEQPAAQDKGWISVDERLPEDRGPSYQVATCAKKVYGDETNYPGQGIKGIRQDWVVRRWPQNFTHWMPLPPAPVGAQ